jgi:hypothetical protein
MRRILLILVIGLAVGMAVGAQTATVSEFSGKVEYRLGNAAWQAVRVGLRVPLNATISTGFGATAVLQVANSRVEVGQLTRLTIEELADNGTSVSTGVFVPVGRVRASVETTSTRSTDFTVRTAQSTAAVRGTEFETNGWELSVSEGIVEFANLLGQSRNVGATQISVVTEGGPTDPADELNRQANVGDDGGPDDFQGGPSTSGYITVRWKYE